jgi:hypothetical protein
MSEFMSLMSLMLLLLVISLITNLFVLQHVSDILTKIKKLEDYVFGNSNKS